MTISQLFKIISITGIIFLSKYTVAQNLVPNSGFEYYTSCPVWLGEINKAFPWISPTLATPDFYNVCGGSNCGTCVPDNFSGNQLANTGNGYAGFILDYEGTNDYKEYIQTSLVKPLVAGIVYKVSFYVSLSEDSKYAIKNIGAYLSNNSIKSNNGSYLSCCPSQVNNSNFVTSKNGWTLISGDYLASGGEQYLTIGNFNSSNNTYGIIVGGSDSRPQSYYYIDDISIFPNKLEFGNDTILCKGEILTLDASNANATYLWQDNSTNPTFNVSQQGTYWVEVTNSYGTTSDTIKVNYNSKPLIELGSDTTLCQGEILTLDASNTNATYIWQDNSTNPTFNVTQQGIYRVKVTTNNCSVLDSINVNYNLTLLADLGKDTTLCQGEILTIDASNSNASYLWQDNSTNSTFNVSQPGTYWVKVTNSCETTSDTINVNYSLKLLAKLGKDTTLCQGEILSLDASNINASHLWQDNSTLPNLKITNPGTYWVKVSNSCETTSDTINVNYILTPFINLGEDTTLCQGEILTLNVSNTNATYLWQDNSTLPNLKIINPGTYWVKVSNSCETTSDTINVNYNLSLLADLGRDTTLCQGETLTLNTDNTNAAFLWQDNSTLPNFKIYKPGTYWVKVSNRCETTSDTINVNYSLNLLAELGKDTTLCQGELLTLNANNPNASYLWQDNSTLPNFKINKPGTYWVKISNSCETTSDTIHVNYILTPLINLGEDTTICQGELLTLNASNTNAMYLWQDNSTYPTLDVKQQGMYWVEVTVNNCSVIDTILINKEDCEIILEIPNVFSPNNDGINDIFVPVKSKGIVSLNASIFNRWGNKVYESSNLQIKWNGEGASDGVYFWKIDFIDIQNNKYQKVGYTSIFR